MTLDTWTDLLSQVGPAHHQAFAIDRRRGSRLARLVRGVAARAAARASVGS